MREDAGAAQLAVRSVPAEKQRSLDSLQEGLQINRRGTEMCGAKTLEAMPRVGDWLVFSTDYEDLKHEADTIL